MNRRDLFGALAILPAAGVMPAAGDPLASVARPSPLRAVFHSWQRAKAEYNSPDLIEDSAEAVAIFDRILRLEAVAAEFEPVTLEDFAFKVIIADDDGDMCATRTLSGLALLAYRLTGIRPSAGVLATAAAWADMREGAEA